MDVASVSSHLAGDYFAYAVSYQQIHDWLAGRSYFRGLLEDGSDFAAFHHYF